MRGSLHDSFPCITGSDAERLTAQLNEAVAGLGALLEEGDQGTEYWSIVDLTCMGIVGAQIVRRTAILFDVLCSFTSQSHDCECEVRSH